MNRSADSCFVPTHNKAASQLQGHDPVWNTANCRNRRFFTSASVMRAIQNTEPLILQTYQRDMGGGPTLTSGWSEAVCIRDR